MDSNAVDVDQARGLPSTNAGLGIKTFCLWKGKLLVKGGSFCNVEMRTENDSAANRAFL